MVTVYKFKGCRKVRRYYSAEYDAICYYCAFENVTSKLYYHADVYIHCVEIALVKNMLKEVNKTHLIYDLVYILYSRPHHILKTLKRETSNQLCLA